MTTMFPAATRAAMVLAAALSWGCSPRGEGQARPDDHAQDEHDHAHEEHTEKLVLSPEVLAESGVHVEPAGGREIAISLDLPGEVVLDADRIAHIVPRFAGIATDVKKALGDHVRKDEVLAVIESNESLAPYEVRALLSGTVIAKHVALGEFVRDDADIFVVADLSDVWVHVTVYARDLDRVRVGTPARISAVGGSAAAEGVIDYIGAVLDDASRSATARLVLANPRGDWKPGMFVTARLVTDRTRVDVTVPDRAIQRIGGDACVFVEENGAFEPRRVATGRSGEGWTEIVDGLDAGERYASDGSFVLKSELLKSEAGHQH